MSETTSATAIYLGFLIFVGWVFFMTTSPWAFALLVFSPTIKTSKKESKSLEGKKESKKLDGKSDIKLIKNE